MGIQTWQPRYSLAAVETASSAGARPPGDDSGTPEGDNGSHSSPPADTSPPSPSKSLDVEAPRAIESGGIPREYEDWARGVDEDEERYFDLDPAPRPEPRDREARIAAMDWAALEAEVDGCTACELHHARTQGVFGVGNREADWLIVGEAPGADEDRLGEPFVGRAGKLLDPMLLALGLTRQQVYIANILKSRPPNNRDPRPDEVRACWPYLERQIELVRPRIILAVGRIAAQNLLQSDAAIGRLRGRVHRFGSRRLPLVVTYHPAYLLRSPSQKAKAWDDLQLARRALLESNEHEVGNGEP
jgi:DNA polymerase